MNNSKRYLLVELTLLFVLIPLVLLLEISLAVKAGIVLLGIIYVLRIVDRNKLVMRIKS